MSKVAIADFGGKLTAKQLLIGSIEEADDWTEAVIISIDKDDLIITNWTSGSALKKVGMLELASDAIKGSMKDE